MKLKMEENDIEDTEKCIQSRSNGGDYKKNMPVREIPFAIEIERHKLKKLSAPITTQSVRKSTCYYTALSTYGFIDRSKSLAMKAERIEAFFYNNGMTITLGGLFLAMNMIVGAHGASQFMAKGGFTTDNDILKVTLPIARAGGRLVTLNCALLLLTSCKYLWTLVRANVVPVIPIGFPIDDIMPKYHRFVALFIIVAGCIIHTLPQIVNYATGSIEIDGGSKIWTFGNGFDTKQLLVTGCILTAIFTTFFLTTLKVFRKTTMGFRWFKIFHIGGIALAYPLLIVHGTCNGNPIFLYCAFLPLVLYLFDVTIRLFKVTTTNVVEWKTYNDKGQHITELVLECPPDFVYTPGQYVELKFESISSHEWHPFTIASAPSTGVHNGDGECIERLVFFIKATGRWTEALYDYASAFDLSRAIKPMEISIRGPHGAPAMNFFEYKHIMVIGSGVGVTPLLSIWQYLVDQGRTRINNDEQISIISENSDTFFLHDEIDSQEKTSKLCSTCSMLENVLNSLTASICLLCLFVTGETITIMAQILGYYVKTGMMEAILASVSLIFHSGTVIVSTFAFGGGLRYFRLFKCWLEFGIIFVAALALCFSIVVIKARCVEEERKAIYFVLFGCITVLLHAVRIFHIFYTTLKPALDSSDRQLLQNRVCSIQGIFITRHYSGMKFALEILIRPIKQGLSRVFSLQLYGTQEKKDEDPMALYASTESTEVASSAISYKQHNHFCFHSGRPDWALIYQKAILKAHFSDSNGATIGVFFCGSPAIAKSLNAMANKITAQHRYSVKKKNGKTCNCKIVVHTENY